MGPRGRLRSGLSGAASVSPASQRGQGLGFSQRLPQGRVFGVGLPFSIRFGFSGSDLQLSLIFGVLPRRAVPVGFPYQQVTMATWL